MWVRCILREGQWRGATQRVTGQMGGIVALLIFGRARLDLLSAPAIKANI